MTRSQLILLYCITIFMMVWGFDIINLIKFKQPFVPGDFIIPFNFSQALYAAVTFLLTRWVCRKFFLTKKYGWLGVTIAGLIFFFILFRYGLEEIIYPALFDLYNYNKGTGFSYYALDNVYYAIIYIALGFLIFLLDSQVGNQKKQALLLKQNREAELQFLRSQINPHFLFNTLNNIYSLVYDQSPKAPSAVLQLSELMRYMLYEKKEAVPVLKEWEYIQNFITLQKLRFDYPVPVELSLEAGDPGKMIAPYLLIPFIENAFKHGDFRESPLIIKLLITEKSLVFETQNRINRQNKDESGGVGLGNVKRRLELLYPQKHTLDTKSDGIVFHTRLLING